MISVIVPTLNHEAVLGRALAPLVSAAISGLVREVVVADGGSSDATLEIADDAGCRILTDQGVAAAAAAAVGDWLLILPPRVQLLPGWEAVVREHVERRPGAGALLAPIDPEAGWLARLLGRPGSEPARLVRKSAHDAGKSGPMRRIPGCAIVIRRGA